MLANCRVHYLSVAYASGSLRIKTGTVFISVFPWLIIKISIIGLTPNARQLPGALFVRRLCFRLVKNKNRKMMRGYSVCLVFFRG